MKKARILLTAFTVLAVVSGALAFKAAKFTHKTTLYSIDSSSNCTLKETVSTTNSGGTAIQASTTNGGTCTTFSTTTGEGL